MCYLNALNGVFYRSILAGYDFLLRGNSEMKNLANMYSLSSKLWYDKRWISKSGEASLYLQVTLNGKHKEFPLKLKWPVEKLDLEADKLCPKHKKDPDVDDYNLIIMMEIGRHTEILRTYRIKKQPIDIQIFAMEVKRFNNNASFSAYMLGKIEERFTDKLISERTKFNHISAVRKMLDFNKAWPFEMLNSDWMARFKATQVKRGFVPGGVWDTMKCIKIYLQLACKEPMLYVDKSAADFPNPEPDWKTVFLNKNELKNLLHLYHTKNVTDLQYRVLSAFLFQCFTSLRISDIYRANSKWRVNDGFLDYIPYKNRKNYKWIHVPIMPMANDFIINTVGLYFKLPNEAEYNLQLKNIANAAGINKRLTSHIGRHTFGYIYMTTIGNLVGLKEIMGHSKIETTMRYAHLDDDYKTESVQKIGDIFSQIKLRIAE